MADNVGDVRSSLELWQMSLDKESPSDDVASEIDAFLKSSSSWDAGSQKQDQSEPKARGSFTEAVLQSRKRMEERAKALAQQFRDDASRVLNESNISTIPGQSVRSSFLSEASAEKERGDSSRAQSGSHRRSAVESARSWWSSSAEALSTSSFGEGNQGSEETDEPPKDPGLSHQFQRPSSGREGLKLKGEALLNDFRKKRSDEKKSSEDSVLEKAAQGLRESLKALRSIDSEDFREWRRQREGGPDTTSRSALREMTAADVETEEELEEEEAEGPGAQDAAGLLDITRTSESDTERDDSTLADGTPKKETSANPLYVSPDAEVETDMSHPRQKSRLDLDKREQERSRASTTQVAWEEDRPQRPPRAETAMKEGGAAASYRRPEPDNSISQNYHQAVINELLEKHAGEVEALKADHAKYIKQLEAEHSRKLKSLIERQEETDAETVKGLQRMSEEYKKEITQLKGKVVEKDSQLKRTRDEITALSTANERLRYELERLHQAQEELVSRDEMQQAIDHAANSDLARSEAEAAVEKLRQELAAAHKELSTLTSRVKDAEFKLESFRDRMKKAESESLNLRRVLRSRGSGAEEASDEQPKPKDNGEEKEQPLDDPSSDEDAGEVKHSKESEEEESGEDAAPAPVPDPVIRTGEADWYSLASAAEKRIEEALQRSLDSARSSFTQEARRSTDAGIAGEPRPSQYLASIEERGDIIASNRQRHDSIRERIQSLRDRSHVSRSSYSSEPSRDDSIHMTLGANLAEAERRAHHRYSRASAGGVPTQRSSRDASEDISPGDNTRSLSRGRARQLATSRALSSAVRSLNVSTGSAKRGTSVTSRSRSRSTTVSRDGPSKAKPVRKAKTTKASTKSTGTRRVAFLSAASRFGSGSATPTSSRRTPSSKKPAVPLKTQKKAKPKKAIVKAAQSKPSSKPQKSANTWQTTAQEWARDSREDSSLADVTAKDIVAKILATQYSRQRYME